MVESCRLPSSVLAGLLVGALAIITAIGALALTPLPFCA